MVFVSRKIVYPVFVIVFILVFFSIIFLFSFNQVLAVNNASIEFTGSSIVLKADINNISNSVVRNPELVVITKNNSETFKLKDFNVGEKFELVKELKLSEDLSYEIFIRAPFSRPIRLFFELDQSTIEPVKAVVQIANNMRVGQEYNVVVRLCNESKNDLFDVAWGASSEQKFFEEAFVNRILVNGLRINECENLYSTLTPIKTGNARINFVLRVGSLIQDYSHVVIISD
jgi:hypothetical protein